MHTAPPGGQNVVARCITPPGMGGVAVIEVRGVGARELLANLFHRGNGKPLGYLKQGAISFGRFGGGPATPDGVTEEACLAQVEPDRWELHCHSGFAIVHWVLQRLRQAGARVSDHVSAQLFGETLAEEAVAAAAVARTQNSAALALYQLEQGATRAIQSIRERLLSQDLTAASAECRQLINGYHDGLAIARSAVVALVGPVNVGKSSLLNAIAGYSRALVSELPGATRTPLTVPTAINGWPVDFIDTAGKRATNDLLERAGQAMGRRAADNADLLLEIHDASEQRQSVESAKRAVSLAKSIRVFNKCDLTPERFVADDGAIYVSAKTGQGLEALLMEVSNRLGFHSMRPNEARLVNQRQFSCIQATLEGIVAGDAASALAKLNECLWGKESVLN